MRKLIWIVAAGVFAVGVGGAQAQAPLLTKDELKCQTGESKALAKFVGAKAKCITKCEQGARKATNPKTDCDPPFAGATATCVKDPLKGAEAKAVAAIKKACVKDCPECVLADNASCDDWADARVATTEDQLDEFVPLLACDEYPPDLTKNEQKCIDGATKGLTKFVAAKDKCYDKCWSNAQKGTVPAANCAPPPPTTNPVDLATNDCVNKAEGKAVEAVVKACAPADADTVGAVDATDSLPECWSAPLPWSGGTAAGAAAFLVSFAEASVDTSIPLSYCGSPSGAFLD